MSLLQGKWYFVATSANGETEEYEHMPCGKDYMEFLPDGLLKQKSIWDCDGETPVAFDFEAEYTTGSNTITITVQGQTQTVNVKKLTSSELEVTYTEDYDEDGDEETVTERMSRN